MEAGSANRLASRLSDQQLALWQAHLEHRWGVRLSVSPQSIQRGLDRRLAATGCKDYETYLSRVKAPASIDSESAELLHSITCGPSAAFCEPALVKLVESFLVGRVSQPANNVFSLDLWSAGCGRGAEAWTLAMLAKRAAAHHGMALYFGVMGTDISSFALHEARAGVYTRGELSSVTPEYFEAGLTAVGSELVGITEELADRVCFVQSNLVTAEELLGIDMDVIVCRNVLPYYARESKHRILDRLVDHLKPGGLLVVGSGDMDGWCHGAVRRLSTEPLQACIRQ